MQNLLGRPRRPTICESDSYYGRRSIFNEMVRLGASELADRAASLRSSLHSVDATCKALQAFSYDVLIPSSKQQVTCTVFTKEMSPLDSFHAPLHSLSSHRHHTLQQPGQIHNTLIYCGRIAGLSVTHSFPKEDGQGCKWRAEVVGLWVWIRG